MKNKKLPAIVLGALLLGSVGSLAIQSYAQIPTTSQPSISNQEQLTKLVDSKDIQNTDTETNDVEDSKITKAVKLGEDQAKQIALNSNPNTKILSVELEEENGSINYEVKLENKVEVKIDANSGKILSSHLESADNENEKGEINND